MHFCAPMSATTGAQNVVDADHELYWSCIGSSGLLKLPPDLSPEVRQRILLIHLNELNSSRIVWTGNLKMDFLLHMFNNHPIVSMFKCDPLHGFTRNQRRANFVLVTLYSFVWSLAIGLAFKQYFYAPILSSNNETLLNPDTVACPNNTNFVEAYPGVTACKIVEGEDIFMTAIATFIFIKVPRMIWSVIVEKLSSYRYGPALSYPVMLAGAASCAYVVQQFYVGAKSHTQGAFIGYGLSMFSEYEPFSTFLFFRCYHAKIMTSGHFDHWQGCLLGHICDSAKDNRVRLLERSSVSLSLASSNV
jgi:hypothetical protein